jgi:putative membrane protein
LNLSELPLVNASLNAASTVFLIFGFRAIRSGKRDIHKRWMLAALTASALFLTSYLIYHANVGSVPYPYHDWTRILYFVVLIPHVIFAGIMTPFILAAVWLALHDRFSTHVRLVRWVWPVWLYVSVSGIIIYLMLYQQANLF